MISLATKLNEKRTVTALCLTPSSTHEVNYLADFYFLIIKITPVYGVAFDADDDTSVGNVTSENYSLKQLKHWPSSEQTLRNGDWTSLSGDPHHVVDEDNELHCRRR
ncbi:hypothetical protein RB195_011599 [Necator americanus]|uniref:Uncharacterized protein n=1 Tax=Necator americanus TaxID=51031 RepID=A0ABR1D442_NECAM